MSVYVGKDVTVLIQVPCEEDVSDQANGANITFTVSKTPISDRDMDGVANETEHVTVYVDGSEVTVTNVNDSTGQVTLESAPPATADVIVEYRYNLDPEIIQELLINPRRSIEGVDGLGSNKIQAWVLLLKECSGSLRETFATVEQLKRFTKKKLESLYTNNFNAGSQIDDLEGDTANVEILNAALHQINDNSTNVQVKTSVLAKFRDGIVKCKLKHVTGDGGWLFRWVDIYNYYRVLITGTKHLQIYRVKDNETVKILDTDGLTLPSDFFPMEIKFVGPKITVDVNDGAYIFSVVDSDPMLKQGQCGFHSYFGMDNYWEAFSVWKIGSPDEYGLIIDYTRGADIVKIGLDGVVFPEGSLPSPKNAPIFITSSFRARKIKFIT